MSILRTYKIVLFLLLPMPAIYSQPNLINFSPGAKSLGLGGSGVVMLSDPSALYWNPALLGTIHCQQAMIAVHQPYMTNLVAYSHFVPLFGSLAFQMARTDDSRNAVELTGFGWGRSLSRHFHAGLALNNLKMNKEGWTTAGLGLLFSPSIPEYGLSDSTRTLLSRLFSNKLTVGFCVQNVPFIITDYDHQIRIGASYGITKNGPIVIFAHHFQREQDSQHFGVLIKPFRSFQLYYGIQDFVANQSTAGLELAFQNICVNLTLNFHSERVIFSTSFQVGQSPEELSNKAYEEAKDYLQKGDRKTAMRLAKKAIAYDASNLPAVEIEETLQLILQSQDSQIDSLLNNAKEASQKGRFMTAAANYMRVLKMDPSNEKAGRDIEVIRPDVKTHVDRWYQAGLQSFENGEYPYARDIFEAVILVDPEHRDAKDHVKKIDDILHEKAQKHYYTGLGFFNQKNYDRAEEEFRAAVDADANFLEALDYLNQISIKKYENLKKITNLTDQAMEAENKGALSKAQNLYQEILKMNPNYADAQQRLAAVQQKISVKIAQQLATGLAAIKKKDYVTAGKIFRTILSLNPKHTEAKKYLNLIHTKTSGKISSNLELAELYMNEKKYDAALALLDSVLLVSPASKEAKKLRQQTLLLSDINQMLGNARSAYLNGAYKEAVDLCNKALEKTPDNTDVKELKKSCQDRLNEQVDAFFNRGLQFYIQEKYPEAINEWKKALRLNDQHKGSKEYIKKAQDRLDALDQLP